MTISTVKVYVIAIAALALAGCRLQIQVPLGGSIESSSGLYDCHAGVACLIYIDHTYFDETFKAVPEPGYAFAGWQRGKRTFCGGTDAACELSTTDFPLYPALMAFLDDFTVFKLVPQFTKNGEVTPYNTSTWIATSYHSAVNYLVKGDTVDQVRASLESDDNPLEFSSEWGFKPDGLSSFTGEYRYYTEKTQNDTMCTVTKGFIDIEYVTTLPQLEDFSGKSDVLKSKWKAYQAGLQEHEADHQEIHRRLATELPKVANSIGTRDCSDIGGVIEAKLKKVMRSVNQASEDYDTETNYGRYTIPAL
jgi:predicted secreted Zn-dependent protease